MSCCSRGGVKPPVPRAPPVCSAPYLAAPTSSVAGWSALTTVRTVVLRPHPYARSIARRTTLDTHCPPTGSPAHPCGGEPGVVDDPFESDDGTKSSWPTPTPPAASARASLVVVDTDVASALLRRRSPDSLAASSHANDRHRLCHPRRTDEVDSRPPGGARETSLQCARSLPRSSSFRETPTADQRRVDCRLLPPLRATPT
jgi:hypothetical protein